MLKTLEDSRNSDIVVTTHNLHERERENMRIWDLDPGFLNDKSLLGEHRELHGLFSIHVNGKKGYARQPETVRWAHALSGLYLRHELLVSEMQLRGFNHKNLSRSLVGIFRLPPPPGRLINALEHMWGYVSDESSLCRRDLGPEALLDEIRSQARVGERDYLLRSTALGELGFWVRALKNKFTV